MAPLDVTVSAFGAARVVTASAVDAAVYVTVSTLVRTVIFGRVICGCVVKGTNMEPRGAKKEPRGAKRKPKGSKRKPKGNQKGTNMHPKVGSGLQVVVLSSFVRSLDAIQSRPIARSRESPNIRVTHASAVPKTPPHLLITRRVVL